MEKASTIEELIAAVLRIQWQALCKDRKRPEGVYFLGDKTQPISGSFSLLVFVIDINLRQRYEIILMIVSFRA